MKHIFIVSILLLMFGLHSNAQVFEVSFASGLNQKDFSGNVLLYLSKENKSPKDIRVGFEVFPVYRLAVENLKPNEDAIFNDTAVSHPVELSNIERGEYYAQVVFDLNLGDFNIGNSSGNIYSEPIKVNLTKKFDEVFKIMANKVIQTIDFTETEYIKELRIKSNLLSEFHAKDIFLNAAVNLPKEYHEHPEKNYPVVFSITGFGGSYKKGLGKKRFLAQLGDQEAIVVLLDGKCSEGHSVYANSDVNGPWGDALVKELIPALNEKYRTNHAILLHGHSSGGWSSLWLQVNYPTVFAGAWASSPDQVDFRNYQNKNIYEIDNMFYDGEDNLFADVTIAGRVPVTSAKDFYGTENVIYRGCQLHSFDAVFGGYDKNQNQIRLVNMPSGEINKKALPLWRRYDLSVILRENWSSLKANLDGKIRISVGTNDNFYLNRSVELLEKEMYKLNANFEFKYYPGVHFRLYTPEYIREGMKFLDRCYKNWLEKNE
ncbi:alpha/beta hydrolase-fold protein [Labilibaculum sp.]|uniref:alpha/beta hydrolase-fold protein n=1 Tax=Labilibaculum sp. TaxID=2060723 RepID=UPI003568D2A7